MLMIAKSNKLIFPSFPLILVIIVALASGVYWPEQLRAEGRPAAESLSILRITPSGEDVPAKQQIVIKFSQDVVALGRMEREIPIKIQPELSCEWRWLNRSSLACQLKKENKLQAATRYKLTIHSDTDNAFISQYGLKLSENHTHSFLTERPKVGKFWFWDWRSSGTPEILVRFTQSVDKSSIEKHIFFEDGEKRRFSVKLRKPNYSLENRWILSPRRELPEDSTISLKVEPGLKGELGEERGIENRVIVQFDTFSDFSFRGIRCTPLNERELFITANTALEEQPRCNPMSDIKLVFFFSANKRKRKRRPSCKTRFSWRSKGF